MTKSYFSRPRIIDPMLTLMFLLLMTVGIITIASTTLFIAERSYHNPFFFIVRHLVHICIGGLAFLLGRSLNEKRLVCFRILFLIFIFIGLIFVLLPGVGMSVNGSWRWINLGVMTVQTSEICKLFYLIFICAYLSNEKLTKSISYNRWVIPLLLLLICNVLLCLQPDFGAAMVFTAIALHVVFVADMPWRFFLILLFFVGVTASFLAVMAPYRLLRLITFLNPWLHAFDSGYQLTQSLMAIGRGGFFGVGLGSGLQKIFYLPEAHTDFIFAVFCEELGMFGGGLLIFLYFAIVFRLLSWAYFFEKKKCFFSAYYTVGLSTWLGIQAAISIGVNIGMLPTKGISLPLFSYGGTHMVVFLFALGIFYRMLSDCNKRTGRHVYSTVV